MPGALHSQLINGTVEVWGKAIADNQVGAVTVLRPSCNRAGTVCRPCCDRDVTDPRPAATPLWQPGGRHGRQRRRQRLIFLACGVGHPGRPDGRNDAGRVGAQGHRHRRGRRALRPSPARQRADGFQQSNVSQLVERVRRQGDRDGGAVATVTGALGRVERAAFSLSPI